MSDQTEYPGVVLITGAGGTGIGNAVARAFVRKRCSRLVLTDISKTTLSSTVKQLQDIGSDIPNLEILAIDGDISSTEFIDQLFIQIKEKFGRLDYAVNCAGVLGNGQNSVNSTMEDFDRINGINYRGLWATSRKELEMMQNQEIVEREGYSGVRRQRGSIVNVASQLGIVGRPESPIYCATKSAVLGLTRCDAIDFSKHSIRVNAVCPGVIDTPMTQVPVPEGASLSLTTATNIAPMKRMGTADEIADVCLFLCSEAASFIQGAGIVVDGGYTIN